jgi:uncharacterized protein involved in type VI secretion and phage assembly
VITGLSEFVNERAIAEGRSLITGVVIGIVTNNNDPDSLGRVKVRFPWLSDTDESFWARVAAPMAGNGRGVYFLPEVDDEVLVMFDHGDVRFPYVIGSLWNGKDKAPADNSDGKNNVRVIQSRSGHRITLNDEDGNETLEIVDGSGKNSIVIDTANNRITISSDKDIALVAPQGAVTISAQDVAIKASRDVAITAERNMMLSADSESTLKGNRVNIN